MLWCRRLDRTGGVGLRRPPRGVGLGGDQGQSSQGDQDGDDARDDVHLTEIFADEFGDEVEFEGRERLIALELEALRHIPVTVAVAVGKDKIESIIAGARGGYFNQLVTDPSTAAAVLESLTDAEPAKGVQ